MYGSNKTLQIYSNTFRMLVTTVLVELIFPFFNRFIIVPVIVTLSVGALITYIIIRSEYRQRLQSNYLIFLIDQNLILYVTDDAFLVRLHFSVE